MCRRIFALLALAISLFGTQCWAQITTCGGIEQPPCSITNTFSPGTTTGTYDFSRSGDGILIVQFNAVLTTFTLTATVNHTPDPLDLNEFPAGTVCVTYSTRLCDQYDFTGNALGPNGVPVRNTDYKGLINLTLSYFQATFQPILDPAFGHAPGDSTTITEDILTGYSSSPVDPTMDGSTPGLSSVVALNVPFSEVGDTFCLVSPDKNQTFSAAQTKVIEVTFQLIFFSFGSCSGTPIRDKTARFSLSTIDPTTSNVVFPPLLDKEEANKFHWDNKDGLNEFDLSTVGLAPGKYTITLFSSKFSPQSIDIMITQ